MVFAPNSLHARDMAYVLHGHTNLKHHGSDGPSIITRGEGIYVADDQGRQFLDGMAGLWCASLGFSEQRLADAAARQFAELPYYHSHGNTSHPRAIDLAERLIAMSPVPMSKVFFSNSGSESNDTAIKLTWYYNNALGRTEKKKIIGLEQGYHGVTIGAASLSGSPAMHQDFDLPLPRFLHTDCPHFYRRQYEDDSEEEFATRCAERLEQLILEEGPETVAAFIAEPIQGAGGAVVPPRTYFQKIQQVLRRYDVLFIVDEVISGFGRTGNMFGTETFDLKPDMITFAKGLSAGYQPIAALMVSEAIYDAAVTQSEKIGVFGHGFTNSAHPVCAAVALETLNIYEDRDIVGHVQRVGPLLQDALRRFADHPLVGDVRGLGLIAGVELVEDKATRTPFPAERGVGALFTRHAEENDLLLRVRDHVVPFCPPLIIEEDEITLLVERFEAALEATWAALRA